MPNRSRGLQSASSGSHSLEVERRLTTSELDIERVAEATESHGKKLVLHERLIMGLFYAIGALAAGKMGDVADILLRLTKALKP